MKIRSLHFKNVGPLGTQTIDLTDDWEGGIEDLVLFTGPNGCGKSIALRAVAMLWNAFGYWLDHGKLLPAHHTSRKWLQHWDGVAVIFEDFAMIPEYPLGLFWGDEGWVDDLRDQHDDLAWFGETFGKTRSGRLDRRRQSWGGLEMEDIAEARKKMILTFDKVSMPNLIYLDAEERRWVTPKRNVGEPLPEQPAMRWLPCYQATEGWKTQLEFSLLNLKTTQPEKFNAVVRDLNTFLAGKEIETKVHPRENRLRVKIKGAWGKHHSLDELSAGEHQVLILVYFLSRWAELGCIVMIDEPNLYLHPSLVNGLLANLEQLVKERDGQLLITSHSPDIWRRYETKGKRLELGVTQ